MSYRKFLMGPVKIDYGISIDQKTGVAETYDRGVWHVVCALCGSETVTCKPSSPICANKKCPEGYVGYFLELQLCPGRIKYKRIQNVGEDFFRFEEVEYEKD